MSSAKGQLLVLLDCVLDGSGSDSDHQDFSQLVERHHELTPDLVEQLRMHSLLQWQCDQVNVPIAHDTSVQRSRRHTKSTPARRPPRAWQSWQWAAAIVLVVFCGAASWEFLSWAFARSGAVAEIVGDKPATWAESSTALEKGHLIYPGRLELTSGTAELKFRSGAVVSVSGPTSLRIESDMLVYQEHGTTTSSVPHTAKGFTIKTPVAEIVDRGTRFRVVAREDGATEVTVLEGEVDLRPSASLAQYQICVREEEAARINNRGSIDRLVRFQRDQEGEPWTSAQPLRVQTIKKVWDQWYTGGESYYLITARGLADDSVAYVDSPHQWNGLTADGIPEILRRADYVQTFNDYRYMSDLEVSVELARPAMLYVFYDKRSPTPTWLSAQFNDSGMEIGLDEGPWGEGMAEQAVAEGPGQSVDNVCRVWQRKCERVGTYKLGPMTKTSEARAMYGIAATPLD